MTKTAKQLEEEARQQMHGGGMFWFTPEQFQTYRTQLLKEQREICAKAAMQCSGVLLREQARRAIKNAEEPE